MEGDFSSITRERMFHIDLVFIIVIGYILAPTPSIGGAVLTELPCVEVSPLHVQVTSFLAAAHLVLECSFTVVS